MPPRDWVPVILRDLIDIRHGFAFKGEYFRDEPPGDILLTPGNFAIGGGFQSDKNKYYLGPVPEEYILDAGDLLITMTDLSKNADTLGYSALVPTAIGFRYLHNQRLGKVHIKPNTEISMRFLYYLLRSQSYREEILASATGTTVRHTSPDRIQRFRFSLPPLHEQCVIADILGTLDAKIELNRRMNATLEDVPRALFRSWFVTFDPVHAKAAGRQPAGMNAAMAALFPGSFEEAASGEIPTGWRLGKLGDIAWQQRRNAQPQETPIGTPYIGLEHMPRKSISLGEWGTSDTVVSQKLWFRRGEILFGKLRPYFHKVGVAVVDGVCSTDIVVIAPLTPEWFGLTLETVSSDEFVSFVTASSDGTKMPRTRWDDMARYEIVIPPLTVARRFSELVVQSVERIASNVFESQNLAAMRFYPNYFLVIFMQLSLSQSLSPEE